MMDHIKKFIAVALIVIFAVVADQSSKIWAEDNFASVRYPDHQIEVTIDAEHAGMTLEEFVKTKYPSLDEGDALRVTSSATRGGERLRATDALAQDDKVAFNHLTRTVVDGYFDYQYARNPGAAWSFLANQSETFRKWFFGTTGIVALIAMGIFIAISKWKNQKLTILTLACIMGGALGNMIDRFRMGYVIDFISWHVGEHYWPTFNIADVFVTGGIALLIIDLFVNHKEDDKNKADKYSGRRNCEVFYKKVAASFFSFAFVNSCFHYISSCFN
jgi:signal peptidase II